MQVKKFEARTMKEALEMVKSQLGPEAIILSARDNHRSFGLVGEGSVEITAAVSEETLHKKKFVESRMRQVDLETFQKIPAKNQKSMIDKVVNNYSDRHQVRPVTSTRYIEIDSDEVQEPPQAPAQRAATPAQVATAAKVNAAAAKAKLAQAAGVAKSASEIQALRAEIASLQNVIAHFKEVPQSLVGTHPGADYGIPFDLSFMFEKLTDAGVAAELSAEILVKAQENIPALKLKKKNLVDAWVARHILETTPIVENPGQSKIQFFVGPAGSGKTTAMVKLASHMVVNEGRKVALLTTDTFKVGATDQMRIYAQILNVPFAIIRSAADWDGIMKYLDRVDDVLVDSPGFGLKDPDEIHTLRRLMPPPILNPRVHYVASATSRDSDVMETARRYSILGFDDVIFTGLDEAAQHGTIYNFARRFGVPLHSFGIGSRIPDDFETATRERVLDLIFKITVQNQASAEA